MIQIDGALLRQRRLDLALTQREVAKRIGATSTLLRRLEEVGDVTHVTMSTMQDLLDALALDWHEIGLGTGPTGDVGSGSTAAVGALLHDHGKGMPIPEIAACLGVTIDVATAAVASLDQVLRACGLRTHHASTGICLVSEAAATAERKGTPLEQARLAGNLTQADAKMFFRILTDGAYVPSLMSSPARRINLQKLVNAGLVQEAGPSALALTASAKRTLGIS